MQVNPDVLSQSVALDGLPEDLAAELIKVARTRPVKAGAVLFEAGDPGDGVYALNSRATRAFTCGEDGEQARQSPHPAPPRRAGPSSTPSARSARSSRPRSPPASPSRKKTAVFRFMAHPAVLPPNLLG